MLRLIIKTKYHLLGFCTQLKAPRIMKASTANQQDMDQSYTQERTDRPERQDRKDRYDRQDRGDRPERQDKSHDKSQERQDRQRPIIVRKPVTDSYDVFSRFSATQAIEDNTPPEDLIKRAFNQFRDRNLHLDELKTQVRTVLTDGMNVADYTRINEQDFKWWVSGAPGPLLDELPVLMRREFFAHNPTFVNNQLVQIVIEKSRKRFDRVLTLELLKYHQQFVEQKDYRSQLFMTEEHFEDFVDELSATSPWQFDELSLYYHCFHLNTSKLIGKKTLKKVVDAMTKIRWGQTQFNQEHLDYQGNHISDLLNLKFKQSINDNIQLFLADLFFGSPSYRDSLLSLSLVVLMLSRLSQHSTNLSDLMEAFRKHAGDEKFAFYIEQHLPIVLRSYNQNLYHSFFAQALKEYKASLESRGKVEWVNISPLDKYFLQSDQVYCNHKNAHLSEPLSYSINPQFDLKRVKTTSKKNKDLLLNHLMITNIAFSQSDVLDPVVAMQRQYAREYGTKRQQPQQPRQHSGPFSQSPKSQFCSSKEPQTEDQSSIGQGFMQYLKRAKEIDTSIQNPSEQSLKKTTPFVQLPKIKNQRPQRERSSDGQVRFEQIKTDSNTQQIKTDSNTQSTTPETVVQQPTAPKVPEYILKDHELLQKASDEVQQILDASSLPQQQLESLQNYLIDLNTTDNYQLYAIQVIMNRMSTEALGKQILFKLFCDPPKRKQNATPNIKAHDLTINYETKLCTVDKDYSKYLGGFTIFPFQVLPSLYDTLLQQTLINFRKRYFKSIIAHMCLYAKELTPNNLNLIIKIAVQQRIPNSLLEIGHMLIKNSVVMSHQQVFQLLDTLQGFKEIDEECEPLLALAFNQYGWDLEYSIFKNYVEGLIIKDQTMRHLHLYELLKDYALLSKRKVEKEGLSRKDIITNYGMQYVNSLLLNDKTEPARKVLTNLRQLKSQQISEFPGYWLHAHATDPDEAIRIFQDYVEKHPDQIDEKYLTKLCFVVQKNTSRLLEFFSNVISEWVFARKVNLSPEFIQNLSVTFMITKEYTSFTTLIKIIFDENLPLQPQTKAIWVRIMKRCPDDAQKGQIKGGIEQIFGEAHQKRTAEFAKQKRQEPSKQNQDDSQQLEIQYADLMPFKERGGRNDIKKLRFSKSFYTSSEEAAQQQ